jgi:hypothetical protein
VLEPNAVLDLLGELDDLLVREQLLADGAPEVDAIPALHQLRADGHALPPSAPAPAAHPPLPRRHAGPRNHHRGLANALVMLMLLLLVLGGGDVVLEGQLPLLLEHGALQQHDGLERGLELELGVHVQLRGGRGRVRRWRRRRRGERGRGVVPERADGVRARVAGGGGGSGGGRGAVLRDDGELGRGGCELQRRVRIRGREVSGAEGGGQEAVAGAQPDHRRRRRHGAAFTNAAAVVSSLHT